MRANPFLTPSEPPPSRLLRLLGSERLAAAAPLMAALLFMATIAAAFWYLSAQDAQRERQTVRQDLEFGQQQLRLRLQLQYEEIGRAHV